MKIGVVVGRFQIDKLHKGHTELLQKVAHLSDVLVVVLGVNDNRGSKSNPLDFMTRKLMIEGWGMDSPLKNKLVVLPIQDNPSDAVWSANLDALLRQAFPGHDITLYCGRTGFLANYHGTLKTKDLSGEIPVGFDVSASNRRQYVSTTPTNDDRFRHGIIYASHNQWPRLFMCVDVALIWNDHLVLGKRKSENGYRLFGGFVDQSDESLEHAALRELSEEAGVSKWVNLKYAGSFKVQDHRYSNPDDGLVMTSLFVGYSAYKTVPEAGDDIDDLACFSLKDSEKDIIDKVVDSHKPLVKVALESYYDFKKT